MNTRVEPSRVGLAILTIFGLVIAMLMVFTGPSARAELVAGATTCKDADFPEGNTEDAAVGEISNGWGSATWDDDDDNTLTVDMNEGWSVEICVKAGQDGVHVFTVTGDTVLGPFGDHQNGISHASWRNASETTTTTVEEETTTTVEEETTTTVEEETTTTVEDEVQGTVITTTTVADEVLDTEVEAEELPFTGVDSELLLGMAVLMLMSGLLVIGLTGRREDV